MQDCRYATQLDYQNTLREKVSLGKNEKGGDWALYEQIDLHHLGSLNAR